MGYRSDVSIVFYTRKPDVVPFIALKVWFDENYPIREAMDEWHASLERVNDTFLLVTYKDVKWYDGYKHVGAVNEAILKFTETFNAHDTDNVAYEFVRIGEETHDIDEDSSLWCDYVLHVRREIIFE